MRKLILSVSTLFLFLLFSQTALSQNYPPLQWGQIERPCSECDDGLSCTRDFCVYDTVLAGGYKFRECRNYITCVWYLDNDGDRYYGTAVNAVSSPGPQWSASPGLGGIDCNDNDPTEHPGQSWYRDADGDGFGSQQKVISCKKPDGYVLDNTDCNDDDPEHHTTGEGHRIYFTNQKKPKGWNCKDGKYTLNFSPGCGFKPVVIVAYHVTLGVPEIKSVQDLKNLLIPKEYVQSGVDQIIVITDNILEKVAGDEILNKIDETFLKPNGLSINGIPREFKTKDDIPADGALFSKEGLTPAFYSAVSLDINLNWDIAGDPVLFALPDGINTLETSDPRRPSAFSCPDGGFTVTNKSGNCWDITALLAINDRFYATHEVKDNIHFGVLVSEKGKERITGKVEETIKRVTDWIHNKFPEDDKEWFTEENAKTIADELTKMVNDFIHENLPVNSFTFNKLPAGHYRIYGIEDSPWFVKGEGDVEEPEELLINKQPNRSVLCPGEPLELGVATGFSNYEWSNGATGNIINITQPGTYSVKVTTETGCVITLNPVTIREANFTAPQIQVSGSTFLCPDKEATLGTGDYASYAWSTGETTSTIDVHLPGQYTVTVTSSEGCTGTSEPVSITALEAPVPVIQNNGPLSFCAGGSVTLATINGYSFYAWSNGQTSPATSITSSGQYTVTVLNAQGCTGTSAPVTVNVFDLPQPVIQRSGTAILCRGENVTLGTAGSYTSWLWTNGQTSPSITVNDNGSFSVVVTDQNGCAGSANPVQVTVNELPVPVITPGGLTTLCPGQTVTLNANGNFNAYRWSNGATGNSTTVSAAGNYTVQVTDNNSCRGVSAPVAITANPDCNTGANLCYAILATQQANLSRSNVLQGGIGVIGMGNRAVIENNSHIDNNNTFVRADIIRQLSGSTIFSPLTDPLTITLPVFETNTATAGANITVPNNGNMTLNGSVYRNINLGTNATITFTQPVVNILSLAGGRGAVINFAACVHLRVRNQLILEENNRFNPSNNEVVVFAGGRIDIDMGSAINVKCMYTQASLTVATSVANRPNTMRGLFIGNRVISGNFTNWTANCGASSCFNWVPNETSASASRSVVVNQFIQAGSDKQDGDQLLLWPNPASQLVNLQPRGTLTKGLILIQLTERNGRVIKQWTQVFNQGMQTITLNTRNIINGLYVIVIKDRNGKQERRKIIIQH